MKITSIEPILISAPFHHGGPPPRGDARPWSTMDTLLVKVATSDGLIGWGEAFGFGACATTRTAISTLIAPLCLGRDSGDIAGIANDVQRRLHNFGRNGPLMYALSGLDIALWDIAGQRAGLPLHRMLGAAAVDRVPVYASLLKYGAPDLVACNSAEAVQRGYRRIKLHEADPANVKAGRDAVGPAIELMVDCSCPWTVDEALLKAPQLAAQKLVWLEEPVWPPEDHRSLARLREETGIDLASGENASTPLDFQHLADIGRVSYLQPSVTKIGGVSAMRTVIAIARERGVAIAPHSAYFGPGLIATLHICAALPGGTHLERLYCDLEASPFGDAIEADGGYIGVPSGPGLGVQADEGVIARYRVA